MNLENGAKGPGDFRFSLQSKKEDTNDGFIASSRVSPSPLKLGREQSGKANDVVSSGHSNVETPNRISDPSTYLDKKEKTINLSFKDLKEPISG